MAAAVRNVLQLNALNLLISNIVLREVRSGKQSHRLGGHGVKPKTGPNKSTENVARGVDL